MDSRTRAPLPGVRRSGGVAALYRGLALVVLNTLLLLAGLELAASWLSARLVARAVEESTRLRVAHPYYRQQPWAETYWNESNAALHARYAPYVGWRNEPFAGETIQVDAQGLRRTPGSSCGAGAYRVFAFGGSTLWGIGAPDDETIPAQLQRELAARLPTPVCVVNFGEIAYVSTQGVIALLEQLQGGARPDLVLFYDGVNDVYAAFQSGLAGAPQNLAAVTARFAPPARHPLWGGVLESRLLSLLRNSFAPPPVADYRALGVETPALADEVTGRYLANERLVAALAAQWGFEHFFFWQPMLGVGAKRLTPQEEVYRGAIDPDARALFAAVYERVRAAAPPDGRLRDLADVFDAHSGNLWIDALGHVTPVGNALVARRMLAELEPRLPRSAP